MENQYLVSLPRQCSSTPVGFGQEFHTKEQCENNEEIMVEDIPLCLKYNIKMKSNVYSVWHNCLFILLLAVAPGVARDDQWRNQIAICVLCNKKGDGINCVKVSEWNMRHVTYENVHKKHTRARRRRKQHREWIKCLVRQLIGKQRHVMKL
jgi:hypothetical protein